MDNAKTKANDLYYRAQQNAPLNRRQVLGLVTILVAVGTVITIAGLTLTGTTIGFFLSLPVLIFFSPILVPLAIFAFFAISSLLGFGGFVSFAVWVYKYYKGGHPVGSDQVDAARYRIAEGAKEVKDRTYAAARDVQGYVASKTDTSVAAGSGSGSGSGSMELYAQSVGVGAASRPLANFHPCVWGDKFIVYNPQSCQAGEREEAEELKVELKRELKEASDNYMRQLKMVDAIQRLGIDYLFVEDVDEALKNLFEMFDAFCKNNHDMHATALSFRLLRQHGYRVSCEVFEKFKDGKDGFKVPNEDGAVAVLEFFEATHLRVHGEDVLDNAFDFTRNYLESVYATLNDPTAKQVHNALNEFSFRRGLPRVEARKYISIYEQYASHHKGLLKLAKLDFNLVQALHRRELSEDSRWWKTLQVPTKLSFVRDRLVESYFWASGSYFEPNYSVARMILAKGLAVLSLMDDVYDAYGTFEELQMFTDAIERWDASCLDKLPDYMKIVYKALLDVFEEVDEELIKLGAPYRAYYGKEAMKYAARAYMEEAQWREQKHKPTTKEYMKLATKTCGYITLIILSCLGVEEGIVTKEAFDWVFSRPPFIEATLIIARLVNDITGHEFEKKREHVRTAVECYMEEHKVGKQEVVSEFYNQMESAWKDINEGFLRPVEFPIPLLYLILNSVRTLEVIYKEGDSYTHVGPAMQNIIKQLYLHPVPY